MSTSNNQNALHAALTARPPRQPLIWPTDDQILRALRRRDRFIIRVLVDEPTGLGLAIRTNPLGGWSSMQFKLNTAATAAFNGDLVPIP